MKSINGRADRFISESGIVDHNDDGAKKIHYLTLTLLPNQIIIFPQRIFENMNRTILNNNNSIRHYVEEQKNILIRENEIQLDLCQIQLDFTISNNLTEFTEKVFTQPTRPNSKVKSFTLCWIPRFNTLGPHPLTVTLGRVFIHHYFSA